jgi:hypothetical protein
MTSPVSRSSAPAAHLQHWFLIGGRLMLMLSTQ